MALYSVYEPGKPPADLVARAESLVFVKDGFSWPAFLVTPFWLLYHRMWLGLALFIGGFVLLDLLLSMSEIGTAVSSWAGMAYLFFFAMEANSLRRYSLERKGYDLAGMAVGGNRDEAEIGFLRHWLQGQRRTGPVSETGEPGPGKVMGAAVSAERPAGPVRVRDDGIIGFFPNA